MMTGQRHIRRQTGKYRRQRGAVLIISMLLLLIMTLIGVTGMRTTTLEEKMVGNTRDLQLAFNAAEGALRRSEDLLRVVNLPSFVDYDGTNTGGYYNPNSTIWTLVNWTIADSFVVDCGPTATALSATDLNVSAKPSCYIEELPAVKAGADLEAGTALTQNMYRITARAQGGTTTSEVILQETFRR